MAIGILATHAFLGGYSRYLADDFCTAGDVARLGFWGAQSNLYQTWSGRFSFSFVIALTHLLGPGITPFLPAAMLVLWLAASTFLMHQWISRWVEAGKWIFPLMLASVSIAVVLTCSPNIYQSLYWQTGMLTYLFPLVLLTAYLGFLLKAAGEETRGLRRIVQNILGVFWPFFMGGFSETYVSVQTAALLSGLAILLAMKSSPAVRNLRRLVVLGLLGSLAALILVVIAPGNAVRQGLLPERPGLSRLITATLKDWYIFTARTVKWHFLPIALLSTSAALAGFWLAGLKVGSKKHSLPHSRSILVWIVAIPFMTFLLMSASIAPYEYAISSFPDARVLITTVFVFLLGILGWSFFLGTWLAGWQNVSWKWVSRIAFISALVCAGLFFIYARQAVITAIQDQEIMRNYAAAWDQRDRNLHAAAEVGENVVYAASLTHMGGGLAEIGYDSNEWINRCVALTYGFDQVIAK